VSLSKKSKIQLTTVLLVIVVGGFWCWRRTHWPIVNWRGQKMVTIIAFGDSLTRGYGARRGMDYPSQLGEKLGIRLINSGVDGNTTAMGLARLERDVVPLKPDLVLLCLGGNDMLQRLPLDESFANLEQIIDRLQENGAVVALLEVNIPLLGCGDRFQKLARRKGCIFVPNILEGVLGQKARMKDEVHPNTAGYSLVTRTVHQHVQSYFK
jgi:acyl-CoA thioesterase-1